MINDYRWDYLWFKKRERERAERRTRTWLILTLIFLISVMMIT